MKCTKCDHVYSDTSYFCPSCGAPNEAMTAHAVPQPVIPEQGIPQVPYPPQAIPATDVPVKKKNHLWVFILGGVVLLGALAVAAVLIIGLFVGGGKSKGDGILVGVPEKSDEVAVYSLKLGKSMDDLEPMLESGNLDSGNVYEFTDFGYRIIGNWQDVGGYVDGTPYLLLSYSEDGDGALYFTKPNPKEMLPIFESDNNFFALVLDGGKYIYINEARDSKERCYLSTNGAEAEQVVKGNQCTIAATGKVLFTKEISKDKMTVKSYDINGKNEVILMDDVEDVQNNSYGYNDTGTMIFYVVNDGKDAALFLVNAANGEIIAESDEFDDILAWDRSFLGNEVYFIALNDDQELELYTLGEKSGQKLVATGNSMMARLDKKGENLVYIVGDEDGEQTVVVHPMGGGEDKELMSGENLSINLLLWKDLFLIKEYDPDKDRVTLYAANTDGNKLTEIFSESDIVIDSILTPINSDEIIIGYKDNKSMFTYYVTTPTSEEGMEVISDWYTLILKDISPDGKTLLFIGREDDGDDLLLLSVNVEEKATVVELDDDDLEGVTVAVFSANGKDVIYNVHTGSDYDEYEIRQVGVDGKEEYTLLYEEALILDVEQTAMDRFDSYNYFSNPILSPIQ